MPWLVSCVNWLGAEVGVLCVVVDTPASDGSDSVVENETLGLRSTSDVSNVMLILGCVMLVDLSLSGFIIGLNIVLDINRSGDRTTMSITEYADQRRDRGEFEVNLNRSCSSRD